MDKVTIQPIVNIARGYTNGADSDNLDPFSLAGAIFTFGETAVAIGFVGDVTIGIWKDFLRKVKAMGCTDLIMQRGPKHTVPSGEVLPEGSIFPGWYRVRLVQ